jgi:hypothetical protein
MTCLFIGVGTIEDEDVAKGRKMEHTAFAPEEGQKVRVAWA